MLFCVWKKRETARILGAWPPVARPHANATSLLVLATPSIHVQVLVKYFHVGTRYYASWVLLCGSFDTAWRLSGTRSLFVNTHGYLTAPHRVMTAMVVTWCLILGLLGLRLLLVLSASYTVCNKNVAQRTHVLKYELWRYSHTAETEITENECIK